MSGGGPGQVEALRVGLRAAVRHGGHAAQLARCAPGLVDLLCPAGAGCPAGLVDRALAVEALLREASGALGVPAGPAVAVLLGLAEGARGLPVGQRRARAARLCGIGAEGFRRRREAALVFELAVEVYRRLGSRPG